MSRPLGLGPAESASGLLMAYQGSTEAGTAVADAIFGRIDPGARLPVSWPSDAPAPDGDFNGGAPSPLGDQPKFFDLLPSTAFGQGNGYDPLFPFGFGLSYTTFQTSGLSVTSSASRSGTVTATFTVSNTGSRAGTDVVPVYVRQPLSSVVVPRQRLVGFARLSLDAGHSTSAHVTFPVSELAVTPGDIDAAAPPRVEPGGYRIDVGSMSAPFTVTG
jgi:beta-glucosidase